MRQCKGKAFKVLPNKEKKYWENYLGNLKNKDDRMYSSCLFSYFSLYQIFPLELLLNKRGGFCLLVTYEIFALRTFESTGTYFFLVIAFVFNAFLSTPASLISTFFASLCTFYMHLINSSTSI